VKPLLPLIASFVVAGCASVGAELAPGFELSEAVYGERYSGPRPISAKQALRWAVHFLERRGVRDIRLCRLNWYQAGVGGAMVYATGMWKTGDVSYDSFAEFIHDGTEVNYGHIGGTEVFMVARGVDREGKETYYDSGGPDGPQILRYEEIVADPTLDLIFEYASREVLTGLRAQCGTH